MAPVEHDPSVNLASFLRRVFSDLYTTASFTSA